MPSFRFHPVIAVAFDCDEVFALYLFYQTDVVDPPDGLSINTKDLGEIYPHQRMGTTAVVAPTIRLGIRKQRRAPGVSWFRQPGLPVTPRYECCAPGVAFAQAGVPKVLHYPFPIIPASSLP